MHITTSARGLPSYRPVAPPPPLHLTFYGLLYRARRRRTPRESSRSSPNLRFIFYRARRRRTPRESSHSSSPRLSRVHAVLPIGPTSGPVKLCGQGSRAHSLVRLRSQAVSSEAPSSRQSALRSYQFSTASGHYRPSHASPRLHRTGPTGPNSGTVNSPFCASAFLRLSKASCCSLWLSVNTATSHNVLWFIFTGLGDEELLRRAAVLHPLGSAGYTQFCPTGPL